MKKIAFVLAGLAFSSMASAVTLNATGDVTVIQCPLLNEDVRINLTTGVVAGVTCNNSVIAMAACHTAGKQTQRSAPLKDGVVGQDANGADIIGKVSCTIGAGDPDCASTPVTGAAMPTASTTNGTVNVGYPGTGACDSTKAQTWAGALTP